MGMLLEIGSYDELIRKDRSIEWEHTVFRDQTLLLNDVMHRGYIDPKNFQELIGVYDSWTCVKTVQHDIHTSPADKQRFSRSFTQFTGADNWRATEACYAMGEQLIAEARACEKEDWSKRTDRELFIEAQRLLEQIGKFCVFIVFPLYVFEKPYQESIKTFLRDQGVRNPPEYLSVISSPRKKTVSYYEQQGILAIATDVVQDAAFRHAAGASDSKTLLTLLSEQRHDVCAQIDRHIQQFGWIPCRNWRGEPWSREDIVARIQNIYCDAIEEVSRMRQFEEDNNKRFASIIDELQVGGELLDIISIAKEWSYLRTYRTDIIHEYGFRIRPIVEEIGKRFGYTRDEIFHMVKDEIATLDQRLVSHKALSDRIREFVTVIIDRNVNYLWGDDCERYLRDIDSIVSSDMPSELAGTVAHKGCVSGTARVVKSVSDVAKVQRGDVLVAPMTFPSLIAAMERAAAFVTDEGGILCHAAIISREMDKPCIIGTKIATQVLKDGDLVEVDANEGVVRILERST